MHISPIQNYKYSKNFTANAPVNINKHDNYEPENRNSYNNNSNDVPEWLRKGALFGLITFAIVNDPVTKQYLKSSEIKQQEITLKEYYKDVSDMGMTNPAYHLNRLGDVDKPIIKSKGLGNYNIQLTLDKTRKIEFDINTTEKHENLLYGYFKSENGTLLKYKAVFNPEKPEEFEIFVRNKENKKYIFGRKPNGELSKMNSDELNKKIIILNFLPIKTACGEN